MTTHALAPRSSPLYTPSPADARALDYLARRMVIAGVSWLREHPFACERFARYPHPNAVVFDETPEAIAFLDVLVRAAKPAQPSRAMVEGAVAHALLVVRVGWTAYEKECARARRGL